MDKTLTLKDLREGLAAGGVEVGSSWLHGFVNEGDIGELLGRVDGRYPEDATRVLLEFLPGFKEGKFRTASAPGMLRAFLGSGRSEGTDMVSSSVAPLVQASAGHASQSRSMALRSVDPPSLTVEDLKAVAAVQGWASSDAWLSAGQVGELLGIGAPAVRRAVSEGRLPAPGLRLSKTSRGDRWRKSDIFRTV